MGEEDDDLPFQDEIPPSEEGGSPGRVSSPVESERADGDKKRLFERAIPEILKRVVERAVESGANRLAEGPENLRHFVQDLKLPKEVLHYLYTQIDDTKNGLYRVVAKEIRDVLEHTKFADELTAALTKLSFEIKTEIRFIPNEAGGITPNVKARVGPKVIKTEIRFIPNETAKSMNKKDQAADKDEDEEGESPTRLPKPEVTSQISVKDRSMKDRSKDARRERRGREDT
jgi:hypothetical protein